MSRSTYGPDYDAAMAGAVLQWRRRGHVQQQALADAFEPEPGTPARMIPWLTPGRVVESLQRLGLVHDDRWLTPMGMLVREAGLAERKRARASS